MYRHKVIVTGIGGNVGQGILRNLRDSFPELILVGTDTSDFTSANHLCNKFYKVPFSLRNDYITSIQKILVQEENIQLIIPSTDYEALNLSKNRNKINAQIITSDSKILEIYIDKYKTYLHHKKLKIPFAKSWLPSQYDFSQKEIIVKPREGRGSRSISINPKNIESFDDTFLIQPLLKGKEITSSIYVDKKNKIHGIFTLERELQNGTTVKAKVVSEFDQQVKMISQKIVDFGGIKGSFNIQSIVNHDGLITPFEINCRVSGTNSIRHNFGFKDVKYLIQEYLFNDSPDLPQTINGVATRILLDVLYPNAKDFESLQNGGSHNFKIF